MRRRALATGIALTAAALAACASDGASRRAPRDPGDAGASANPFRAVAARIHPLTRIVPAREGDAPTGGRIEAHVELADRWGLGVRDVCTMRFGVQGGPESEGAPERQWVVDLLDLAENAKRFDAVTRTYVVPLLDAPAWISEGRGTLTLVVETESGERLSDARRLGR